MELKDSLRQLREQHHWKQTELALSLIHIFPLPPVSLGHNSTALARHLITDHTARNRGVQRVYFSLHGQGYDKITTFFDQAADAESLRTCLLYTSRCV